VLWVLGGFALGDRRVVLRGTRASARDDGGEDGQAAMGVSLVPKLMGDAAFSELRHGIFQHVADSKQQFFRRTQEIVGIQAVDTVNATVVDGVQFSMHALNLTNSPALDVTCNGIMASLVIASTRAAEVAFGPEAGPVARRLALESGHKRCVEELSKYKDIYGHQAAQKALSELMGYSMRISKSLPKTLSDETVTDASQQVAHVVAARPYVTLQQSVQSAGSVKVLAATEASSKETIDAAEQGAEAAMRAPKLNFDSDALRDHIATQMGNVTTVSLFGAAVSDAQRIAALAADKAVAEAVAAGADAGEVPSAEAIATSVVKTFDRPALVAHLEATAAAAAQTVPALTLAAPAPAPQADSGDGEA